MPLDSYSRWEGKAEMLDGTRVFGEPGEYRHPTARLEINPHYGSLD
ncbi:MAG TPA: hypothetical protein PLI30_12600 [Petrimonas sp.]|nr:hypothetical protein [Petrimonas sp.]